MLAASLASSAGLAFAQLLPREAKAIDYPQPVPEAEGLTSYRNGSNLLIRWNNLPVLGYRAHSTLKYPYFSPLNGPVSGISLVSESALPYPHHRGLWLGCDPLNGGDYWSDGPLERGRIRSTELKFDETASTPTATAFTERCEWERPDAAAPLRDERHFVLRVPNDQLRLIDCRFKLTAQEDIVIERAKHSFFAMRAAADISPTYGGILMNASGGVGAKGTYGKPANWCGYHGKRKLKPEVVEGIAIMNHPDNFGGNCPWFTREYGHLSPSPLNFLEKPWRLAHGEVLELKYRVVLHAGTPQEAGLDGIYNDWMLGC
jgi:hypothetical protein